MPQMKAPTLIIVVARRSSRIQPMAAPTATASTARAMAQGSAKARSVRKPLRTVCASDAVQAKTGSHPPCCAVNIHVFYT